MLIHMSRGRHGQAQKSFADNAVPLSNIHGYHNSLLHATLHNIGTKDSDIATMGLLYLDSVGDPELTQNKPYDCAIIFRYTTCAREMHTCSGKRIVNFCAHECDQKKYTETAVGFVELRHVNCHM
jgi:hypothetical protein